MSLKVVDFTKQVEKQGIPDGLRELADQIESGELSDVLNLAFVVQRNVNGDDAFHAGVLGEYENDAIYGYYLFGMAQRVLQFVK